MRKVSPALIALLGGLSALGPFSIDAYLPSLPTIAAEFGKPAGAVQLTVAAYFIGIVVGQIFHGPLSDGFGRKPPLLGGLVLYVLASIGCAMATSVESMVVLRFVQALGGCAGAIISRAVVRDFVTGQEAAKVFSSLLLAMGLAPILAPLLGGQILLWLGWRAIFAVLTILGLLCFFAAAFGLPETLPPKARRRSSIASALTVYAQLLSDRRFMGYALAGGFAQATMFTYIVASPHLLIVVYDIPAQHYGWIFGSNAFGYMAMAQVNRALLHRWSLYDVLRWGLRLNVCGALALLAAASGTGSLLFLLAPLFVTIASLGIIMPNATAAAMATHPEVAGSASALSNSFPFLAGAAAGGVLGLLPDGAAVSMAALIATYSAFAFLICRLARVPAAGEREP